jgi:hypothetical protein
VRPQKQFRSDLYKDFEGQVLVDYESYDSLYGLEKLWAFHYYAGFPKDESLEIDPKVLPHPPLPRHLLASAAAAWEVPRGWAGLWLTGSALARCPRLPAAQVASGDAVQVQRGLQARERAPPSGACLS